ncbi:MAG: indole-3-glycerol phosphate synthase TrpC [Syntrophales bacterium]|jgi:indole-3-glycerol phosphate synthase|nr:indole-3-glycerol phosphate synthase TrpC [Syntrophales bacterium]
METYLDRILEVKRREVDRRKKRLPRARIEEDLEALPPCRDFLRSVSRTDVAIIAEIKKKSPSAGLLQQRFSPLRMARIYERAGAAAVSVLTDSTFFGGRLSHLRHVKAAVGIPVLRKDFILDPWQVVESRAARADAVLLIAAVLKHDLAAYRKLAARLGMAALVEVHDRRDLEFALAAGSTLIGINNRNLRTFRTDLQTSIDLAAEMPEGVTIVSESGIRTGEDIERLRAAGIRAFLVGESLMRASAPAGKLKELAGR